MNHSFDVLIIGGGVVGLTAALGMAKRHYSVAVIDSGELKIAKLSRNSRVYAINKASQTLLQELEVWPDLEKSRISPYRKMHVWDAANRAFIDFDSRSIAEPGLGFIIEESNLKNALLQQIAQHENITLSPHCLIEAVQQEKETIQITSKEGIWIGQLLMIADGANSPMRQKLNIELTSWPYNQHALVTTVTVEKSHQYTAYQVFKESGPLAFLPLADPKQCSIVWSSNSEHIQQLMNLPDTLFEEALNNAFAEKLGRTKIISPRYQFPLHMRHVKNYSGSRWVILGDAAHTIHPLAGLGLNVGLADVNSWLNIVTVHKKMPITAKKLLGAYHRERKHAVWQIIVLMEGFKRLFSSSLTPIIAMRGLGLRTCNQLTFIKRLFIKHAAG